jgi:small conductance mechanosensitive channel
MEEPVKWVDSMVTQGVDLLTSYGLNVVGAIVILIVGLWASGWLSRLTQRLLARTERVDVTLQKFFGSLVKYVVIAFTVLAVLSEFGVQTASLIAIFGAAGLAVGLALQGTLTNVAAGVMLLIFRPFKVDDFVEAAGVTGTVKAIGLFTTEFATLDNVQIIAPNGQLWGAAVKNYSFHPTRMLQIVLGIAYEDNIDTARKGVLEVLSADPRCHKEPEPLIAVSELGESSVNITIRIWCDADNYWPLYFDIHQALKEKMDSAGITIPYPQRVVHGIEASDAA